MNIRDFALINNVEIEFDKGLNVITGETGAGKSILIGALYAILGAQAKMDWLREGASKCTIEALFEFSTCDLLIKHMGQLGIESDDGQLFLRREILPGGRSRAYVNGNGCPIKRLKQIGELIVDLHGQHDHQALFNTNLHINYLDSFAKNETLLTQLGEKWSSYQESLQDLEQLEQNLNILISDQSRHTQQQSEIKQISPEIDEETKLEKELTVLDNAQNLIQLSSEIFDLLYEGDGAIYEQLGQTRRLLDHLIDTDSSQNTRSEELDQILYAVEDLSQRIRDYGSNINADTGRISQIRQRIDAIRGLKRKYGQTIEELLKYQTELESIDARIIDLQLRIKRSHQKNVEAQQNLEEVCIKLSLSREIASKSLEQSIALALSELNMEQSTFSVQLRSQEDPNGPVRKDGRNLKTNERGCEQVEFLISPNLGEPLRPLARIASGGEVSRTMLAIKESMAERDPVPVLIFDEIDTGISGRIATSVGRKLQKLAQSHQLIVITHLPQVAGLADHHFCVNKQQIEKRTVTTVSRLSENERTEEIARLLAGETVSETARQHARELME
ncbi:MAG: DNA repair protein RecN [Candidatus Latescibacterota bacterium]|nr:DNA repair protein RecN [Candidatus Latescibacterota bacterium]